MNLDFAGSIALALHTTLPRSRVAALFLPPIWQRRKCGWTEWEITSEFAELIIEADSPILLHGDVVEADTNVDQILSPLMTAGIAYSGELHDGEGAMIREFQWGCL